MLSTAASKNPTQRHTQLMRMGFHCGLIYDEKMGNKPNAAVQPPRGMARGPRARRVCWSWARRNSPSLLSLEVVLSGSPGLDSSLPQWRWQKREPQRQVVQTRSTNEKSRASGLAGALCTLKEANQQTGELKRKVLQLALRAQISNPLFVT